MRAETSRSLIINADDFGYNDAITQGILQGFRSGLVTSTSAMVNIDGSPERIAAAHLAEPGLPIGLHLNLTSGRPVLPADQVPHLVRPDGRFFPFEELLVRISDIPLEEVRREARAQAERLRASGGAFDHIDYHQQVMALSNAYFEIVVELAREYCVPVRQPALAPVRGRLKASRLGSLSRVLGFVVSGSLRHPIRMLHFFSQINSVQRKQLAASLGSTDWFVGAFFEDPTLENFATILRQLPAGLSEMMSHPALDAPELYSMPENYRSARPCELAVLLDPRSRAEVDRLAIHLTDFSAARNSGERIANT